jgi:hypothetical protein
MSPRFIPGTIAALALMLSASTPWAVTIDGRLDPDYGVALSTQTTQTDVGDDITGLVDQGLGSELDAAHGFIADGVLHLFIDSQPGGQNRLGSANPNLDPYDDLNVMNGLTFDTGFAPDYWLGCGGGLNTFPLLAYFAQLPTAGGGAGYFLGASTPGGPGTLAGGTDPYGILAALDNSNTAGVTAGCGASSGTGVTTGVELAIPLAAIGNPTGCVLVSAFVTSFAHTTLSNQVLGPLPPGTCSLGAPGAVDFNAIPGLQYFEVCPAVVTPAHPSSWGRLKTIYR